MSISVYCGASGSGKTYEVVESVILPALKAGRRIVTNIAGLDLVALRKHVVEKMGSTEPGEIVRFTYKPDMVDKIRIPESIVSLADAIEKNNGVVGPEHRAVLAAEHENDNFLKGGDLFIFDEAWRLWPHDAKILPLHMEFMRMHRHYTHPQRGDSVDIVLITQVWGDLNRSVRGVTHHRVETKKHLRLGWMSRYVVMLYGAGQRKPDRIIQKKYRKDIYSLYRSYSFGDGAGAEQSVDGRNNLLKGSFFRVALPLALVCGLVGGYGMWRFFFKNPAGQSKAVDAGKSKAAPGPSQMENAAGKGAAEKGAKGSGSGEFRLIGYMDMGRNFALVRTEGGAVRYIDSPRITGWGMTYTVMIDGSPVSYWTGSGGAPPTGIREEKAK